MAVVRSREEIDWLQFVRREEFSVAAQALPPERSTVTLELGSGNGFLLSLLGDRYDEVHGVEVETSAYNFQDPRIQLFDGVSIPHADNHFDLVFSSHVIEHVEDLPALMSEVKRVLKPGGIVVHVAPSPTWRVLTSVFHYSFLISLIFENLHVIQDSVSERAKSNYPSVLDKLLYLMIAPRHGVNGNRITEGFYFSRKFWTKQFRKLGFTCSLKTGSGIVYWGHDVFRFKLQIHIRKRLANIIGSSSLIYVLHTSD